MGGNMYFKRLNIASICLFLSTTALGSERITINLDNTSSLSDLKTKYNLNDFKMVPIKKIKIKKDEYKIKYQQQYHDIPIWGESLSATETSGKLHHWHGRAINTIGNQHLLNVNAIKGKFALEILKSLKPNFSRRKIRHPLTKKYIYSDENNVLKLVYLTSYVLDGEFPERPMALIDAQSGNIIRSWNAISTFQSAKGPGGNFKIGQYSFGKQFKKIFISKDCKMSTFKIDTYDMDGNTDNGNVFTFKRCDEKPENTYKETNGAFSPLNDAHAFTRLTVLMFKDWYHAYPTRSRLKVRVHYGKNIENAFWDGEYVSLGDGGTQFHPFSSPDVIAHEIGHAFTENNSNLLNENQPGGINESFSDVTGAAFKFYLNKQTYFPSWLHGESILKGERGTALRYFENPEKDGVSITHVNEYKDGMNPHHAAGIFNHAFYLLANKPNWSIKEAYSAFVLANEIFWQKESSFDEAGCGVLMGARDLSYNVTDVISSFNDVGVDASCQATPRGNDIKLNYNKPKKNLDGAESSKHYFVVKVPQRKNMLEIQIDSGLGDADMYVLSGKHPTLLEYQCRPFLEGNNETCRLFNPKAGNYYIMLHGYNAYEGVTLRAKIF